ncbi:MAG: stage sporulation protein [Blastocatellia bacterium]|jgi:SpoIID/LytB domain protein|nr:stage sporulation protein [Blastocatellia bacterium]
MRARSIARQLSVWPSAPLFITALLSVAVLYWWLAPQRSASLEAVAMRRPARVVDEDEMDARLQRAASAALDGREGAVVVINPQDGRLRAVVNPSLAFEQAFSPGSTVKVFTALVAMQSNLIDEKSRLLCRERYQSADFEIHCSHPKIAAPFDPAEALAYSCNYYFGKLGERVNEDSFKALLSSFGFGARTNVNHEGEATGSLPRGASFSSRDAIGEGSELRVTPVQLLAAYAALVNGGHLYTPQLAAARGFRKKERASLSIAPAHRALLIEGMRGAVTYGTALRAGLNALPLYIFGKTGTATASDSRQTQGWFVGFASEPGAAQSVSTDGAELAVLVFLKQGHGAESAEAARIIFEAFARQPDAGQDATRGEDTKTSASDAERRASDATTGATDVKTSASDESKAVAAPAPATDDGARVRVRLVGEERTVSVSFEDYVLGVLATEGAIEEEPEALKALAVAVRTYALRNLKRHAADGYDFCSTTHCQRYTPVAGGEQQGVSERLRRAFEETAGEVLLDEAGRVADAYFHAACGGMTANVSTLWGATAPKYLRGVSDEYCATMPHHDWTDVIPASRLAAALSSDARTDVGPRLDNVILSRRDRSGRAELITLEGARRRVVRGWDFKIIVGRFLGWNMLKSSRFIVSRAGGDFIFRGGGFGHGLGLCQEGAHVMAHRGINYRRILQHYFPSTSVGHTTPETDASEASNYSASEPEQAGAARDGCSAAFNILRSLATWKADVLMFGSKRSGIAAHDSEPHGNLSEGSRPARVADNARVVDTSLVVDAARVVDNSYVPLPRSSGSQNRFLSLAGEHFRVSYPAGLERREAENILRAMEAARAELAGRVNFMAQGSGGPPTLDVIVHATTGDFVVATGQPPWAAAATRGRRIELQPLAVLRRRGVLLTTLRHEYAHVLIDALSLGRAPRWLAEGLAMRFAGEGRLLARFETKEPLSLDELEQKLARPASATEMRALYAKAYSETLALVRAEGESNVWRRVARKD